MATNEMQKRRDKFSELLKCGWKEVLFDSGSENWRRNWFLDGKKAELNNTDKGLDFFAGPTFKDDSCHAVLWTKDGSYIPGLNNMKV